MNTEEFKGHTPGPWSVHIDQGQTVRVVSDDKSKYHRLIPVCTPYSLDQNPEMMPANAALIAAAPDLLAENERLRAAIAEIKATLYDESRLPAYRMFRVDDICDKLLNEK